VAIRAFGADDVAAALYTGERLRKLRSLMTDNTKEAEATKSEPLRHRYTGILPRSSPVIRHPWRFI
jgi:hypothetical protein